jgi:hypothetical protein
MNLKALQKIMNREDLFFVVAFVTGLDELPQVALT